MSIPLENMEIKIKDQYAQKIEQLKYTIKNAIDSFEKDSGCQVTWIECEYSFNLLSFAIVTDIHKESS